MPQPYFSNEDLDGLLSTQDPDDEYQSVLDDLDEPPAAGTAPAPAAPASDPALSTYLAEDLRQRREEMQRRQEDAQRAQFAESQRRQEEARAQRQRDLDARLDSVFQTPEAPALTAEEQAQYSQSLPLIQRMAEYHSRQAVAGLRDTVRDALAGRMELEDRLEALQRAQQVDPRAQLDTLVRAQVPEVDQVLTDPQWATFRDTMLPNIGLTPGQIIQSHYQNGNAQGVASVLKTFQNRRKTTRQETPAPGATAASGPSPRPSGRGKLRYSELNTAYARAEQGTLSRDKLAIIVEKFENAAAEGRVDYER